jgi:hypothetical protein
VDRIKQAPFVFLEGLYFLDNTAFVKHSETIRAFFRPLKRIEEKIDRHIKKAREGANILIGVHIRQGDYREFRDGMYYYTTEEYAVTMEQVAKLLPDRSLTFLICSDAPQDHRYFQEFSFEFGPGHFIEDLYALAACDYIIGPPSTFSQWASFYGRVPRYVINYKAEQFYGIESREPLLENFSIHSSGFGKYI